MTAAMIPTRSVQDVAALGVAAGQSIKTAVSIPLQALQVGPADNMFGDGVDTYYWKVDLKKGDLLGLDLKAPDSSQVAQVKVLDANKRVLATSSPAADSSMAFSARSSGTYYLQVVDKTPQVTPEDDILDVQKFALNTGKALPSSPDDGTDHRWSWVSGNTLYIADSSGTGFGIKSDWKKTVTVDPTTGLKEASYASGGKMTIDVEVPVMSRTADGKTTATGAMKNDAITLTGSLQVATNPGEWGVMVGTIGSTDLAGLPGPSAAASSRVKAQAFEAGGSVHTETATGATLNATTLLNSFSQMYGINATGSGVNFGMDQGSNLGYLGAPLNPNETYFFATYNSGPSASFGGISASASGASSYTLIIDPADPFVYVNVGPVTFGGSVKGLIPFTPTASNYAGPTFGGNLYGKVTGVQLGDLPVTLDGSETVSLDPNQTGHPLGINGNASTLFTTAGLQAAFSNIAVGVNGTANVGYSTGGVDFTIPVGTASAGYLPSTTVEQLQLKTGLSSFIYNILPAVVNPGDELFSLYKTLDASFYNDVQVPATIQQLQVKPGRAAVIASLGLPATKPIESPLTLLDQVNYNVVTVPKPPTYEFGVSGMTVNPLQGTPLQSYFTGNQYAFSANSTGSSPTDLLNNLTISANYMSGGGVKLFGYQLGQNDSLGLTANRNTVTLNASIGVFVGQANLTGTLNLNTGGFDLNGSLDPSDFPASQFLNTTSGNLVLSYDTPGVANGLVANVNLGFNHSIDVRTPSVGIIPGIDLGTFGASGNVGGSITIDTTNSNYGGSLYANASLTAFSKSIGGGVSASIQGQTVTIDTPVPYLGNFSFNL